MSPESNVESTHCWKPTDGNHTRFSYHVWQEDSSHCSTLFHVEVWPEQFGWCNTLIKICSGACHTGLQSNSLEPCYTAQPLHRAVLRDLGRLCSFFENAVRGGTGSVAFEGSVIRMLTATLDCIFHTYKPVRSKNMSFDPRNCQSLPCIGSMSPLSSISSGGDRGVTLLQSPLSRKSLKVFRINIPLEPHQRAYDLITERKYTISNMSDRGVI